MRISIIVPWHFSPEWEKHLSRCLKSIEMQSFKNYEVLMLKKGRAAETQNALIRTAQGDIIKILHMDDYLTDKYSLEKILATFDVEKVWHISGCLHDDGINVYHPHHARYSHDIHIGNNTIGAPSVLTFRNGLGVYFDEDLDWLYDVSLYKKLFDQYGPPSILDDYAVTIGLHPSQLTHQIPEEQKTREVELMRTRYE